MEIFLYNLQRLCRARSWHELLRLLSFMFYDVEATRQMMTTISKKMVGETVMVFIRPPLWKDLVGAAYLRSQVRTIDIHPDIVKSGLDWFYLTWLHELGHHSYRHDAHLDMPPEIEEAYVNGYLLNATEQQLTEHEHSPQELEAMHFVCEIDKFANRRASIEFRNNSIKARLRVLMNTNFSHKEN
jgi:hypothetical protein